MVIPSSVGQKEGWIHKILFGLQTVNAVTKKDAQPLPRIDETLDVLWSAWWFSCLDLTSGYWQVEVAPEDREKTAFVTPYGLFQFRVMPFGLTKCSCHFSASNRASASRAPLHGPHVLSTWMIS